MYESHLKWRLQTEDNLNLKNEQLRGVEASLELLILFQITEMRDCSSYFKAIVVHKPVRLKVAKRSLLTIRKPLRVCFGTKLNYFNNLLLL